MPKLILTPTYGVAEDASVLATALAVARLFDGHLIALHARPDIRRAIGAMAAPDLGMASGLDQMAASLEAQADEREQASSRAWVGFRDANGVTAADAPGTAGVTGEWQREVGDPAEVVGALGRSADLIVAGKAREDGIMGLDVLEAALMDSGRPLLIAPDAAPARLDGPLVVAWKDTRESAKAVAAALPFIARASSVIVLTVRESADAEADPSVGRLVKALRWHNPKVEQKTLPRGSAAPVMTLLAAARDSGATLLVMGGYGHTRLREAVFGGFTRAVLETAPLPVLMAH